MVVGDRSFKLALTEKDEEFSDELREDCEMKGDGYRESKRRGGREVEDGWRGRGIPVSVLECKCLVSRTKGVFLLPLCVCPSTSHHHW